MKRTYYLGIDGSGADELLRGVEEFQKTLERKTKDLCKRCADLGATSARLDFMAAYYQYKGPSEVSVEVVPVENGYSVQANGEAVLFLEFGAGDLLGHGHPEAVKHDMGPGTWPPKDPKHPHWNDPNGWYLPKEKGGGHTYGNPPMMAMYNARKLIEQNIKQIVTEVFADV